MNPERLVERIMAQPDPNSLRVGALTNRLLKEFQGGYPLDNLRPLLRSKSERLVSTGIWIASELGEGGKPLLNDVSPLVGHPSKKVRYFAIDCILLWAGPSNKSELASVVALIDDPEPAVRQKAMDFVARASNEQLRAALSHIEATEPKSVHVRGLRWLLGAAGSDAREVTSALRSPEAALRRYGVAAAARMFEENSEPILYASSVEDPDIRRFTERFAATA